MSRVRSVTGQALLEVTMQVAHDSARLSKGRTYFRQGRVALVDVAEGTVRAEVEGSRWDGYDVTVFTRVAPPHVAEHLTAVAAGRPLTHEVLAEAIDDGVAVVPREADIAFDCSCPDWGDPCKHGVAVLFALAAAVDDDPDVLLRWRGIAAPEAPSVGGPDASPPVRGPVADDGPRAQVIELVSALAGLTDRSGKPLVRRAAQRALDRQASQDETDENAEPDPEDAATHRFFHGLVPATGSLLAGVEDWEVLDNPLTKARLVVDGTDAAPVLADAVAAVRDALGDR